MTFNTTKSLNKKQIRKILWFKIAILIMTIAMIVENTVESTEGQLIK